MTDHFIMTIELLPTKKSDVMKIWKTTENLFRLLDHLTL